MTKEELLAQIQTLDSWFEKNNYRGYDPYDLFDTKLFHRLINVKQTLLRKINRKIISWFIFLFPSLIIRLFGKKPNINAKGMGLLLKAKCNLYKATKNKKYLDGALVISNWLIENKTNGLTGYGWGYPFDWSSSKFIPKHTPSSVVSTVIGDGFFDLYQITHDITHLNVCDKICVFLITDLNIDEISNDSICFSYTPIDNNHVINANLFAAEFLVRIGKYMSNNVYLDLGKRALNYTLSQQNQNGDFLYWGSEDSKRLKYSRSNSDHYHTGFELRMLFQLWKLLDDARIKESLDRYYKYYIDNFINWDFSINIFPKKIHPINIHACSEVLICNSIISEDFHSEKINLDRIYDWIQDTMVDSNGLYMYEIRKALAIKFKNKFKFNRWSQAWMFLALTEYYKHRYE